MIAQRRLLRVSRLAVLGLVAAGPAAAGQRPTVPMSGEPRSAVERVGPGRLDRLELWMKAVARHAPGEDDDQLQAVASMSNQHLRELWIDANALAQITRLRRGESPARFVVRSEGQKVPTQISYTSPQLHRLRVLACAAGGVLDEIECVALRASEELDEEMRQIAALARASKLRGDANYILRRGALLHGDVAVLAPLMMTAPAEPTAPAVPPVSAGPRRFRMEVSDGREIGLRASAVHWEVARMLLDFVQPNGGTHADPARDAMVRAWYRATAAWMQLHEDHDKFHLDRARGLFPADADLLFLSACQRETYAGSPIQNAVRSASIPTGVHVDVESERTELHDAEAMFRRTLELRPDYAEARMRHGRVLGLLGRHDDAAVELRRARPALSEPEPAYYAALFLGAEEEALGNRDAARAAYEHAATAAPLAQSPLLALSQLARRGGDRPAALAAAARLFELAGDDPHDDPWWWYYVNQARDADALLDAVRQPFVSERLR